MIKIAICDDNKAVCSQLEDILLEYARHVYLKIDVSVFYSGESLLKFIVREGAFDLIYLDIEMGEINGVEVGKKLRNMLKDFQTEIVFISGTESYDRQLFDVQPLHFIPKPISESIVIDDLKLALERGKKLGGFFQYQKGYDAYKIPINEIIYFESISREVRVVTTKGSDSFYAKLDDIAERVSEYQFFQIHRSYLINYNQVTVLRYSQVIMSNEVTLQISRSKRQAFRNFQINET